MKDFRHERYWYIKRHNFLHALTKADTDALITITKFKILKHAEHIIEQGVYLIKEGRIKISEHMSDVKTVKIEELSEKPDKEDNVQTTEVLAKGEIFGVIDDEDVHSDNNLKPYFLAETLTEVCIGIISIRDFKFFLKRKPHLVLPLQNGMKYYKEFRNFNLHFMGKNNFINWSNSIAKNTSFSLFNGESRHTNALSNITFRSVSSRLALLLQNLALTPNSKGKVLTHRVTKNQIAKLIGCSNETVENYLKTLRNHTVIDYRMGKIQIINQWMLKKIADARMKTLLPPKDSNTIQDYEYDLQAMTNLQEEVKIESISAHTSL